METVQIPGSKGYGIQMIMHYATSIADVRLAR